MNPPPSFASGYSEDELVEQPAIEAFQALGWETANLYHEKLGAHGTGGRETEHEVILPRRLRSALERLNPGLPTDALNQVIEELTRDRSKMLPVNANREIYELLKDGVKVTVQDETGNPSVETVRLIDWNQPEQNDFFLASQFWVSGDMYRRRCDLVGFVNGLPLLFMELKAVHKNLKNAYDHNLQDYRYAIPQLFWYNALIVLSNGSQTRLGSLTSEWEHFHEWKKINSEGETGLISLDTAIKGVCEKSRLLDLVENFTVFEEVRGGLAKKTAKNHQYLGVNQAVDQVKNLDQNQGRLGVFWHTQGSGKSLSMVFFSQKILRKITGNWTFVIITDREDLDDQIYKTFTAVGAVKEKKTQAESGRHLRQLLTEDHRYVFTLIQKFHADRGTEYPKLSDRSNIIVITDEAHRGQYDLLALNMRNALPKAAFIGFTGTPLMAGEEKTREVFGDYVSIYNFAQSIEDGATVPLFYENRIPELQLTNQDLNRDMERLLEEAELDYEQERRLEREFSRQYHLITREDRLEKVAEDIVRHYMGRGHRGKAMVICIDKATAVRMYDKVESHWCQYLDDLYERLEALNDEDERRALQTRIDEMEETDLAVVVSQAQNEAQDLLKKGLDITPHRRRLNKENLEEKFKDPDDNLRLVFVCAMWITGFDVPSCSTIYLDKPMRNHTLMQTIARANRVFPGKTAGLIVDYVGILRNLQMALAIYALPTEGPDGGEVGPIIKNKAELVEYLKRVIAELAAFCRTLGIDTEKIKTAKGFEKVALIKDAVEALLESEDTKKTYLQTTSLAVRVFKAILPDPLGNELAPDVVLFSILAQKIKSLTPPPDISEIMDQVEDLLDESVAAEGYIIRAAQGDPEDKDLVIDLSRIDFEKLRQRFIQARKRTEIEKLKGLILQKLQDMVMLNKSRVDYLEKFQKLIDEYNSGSRNLEQIFEDLIKFVKSLNEEEKRALREGLSEEELALFDILTKPNPGLTKKEEAEVKKVARTLLQTLKAEKLVLDWRTRQATRADVRLTIEKILDELPDTYDENLYQEKCDLCYRHVYDAYYGDGKSLYQPAA